MWAITPIVPAAVKAAKARERPTAPISRGAHQQPMKKPKKCADPIVPISALQSQAPPPTASRGATDPVPSCRKTTDRNRAAKETRRRMGRLWKVVPPLSPSARECPERNAARSEIARRGQGVRTRRARIFRCTSSPTMSAKPVAPEIRPPYGARQLDRQPVAVRVRPLRPKEPGGEGQGGSVRGW